MKKLVFVLCILSNFLFGQDQIVLRETSKAIWKELEIKKVTADSITYSLQQKKNIEINLPIKNIIAYRKDYESNPPFVFPNTEDKGKFNIKNGRAIIKVELFLRAHKVNGYYNEDSLTENNIVKFNKINSKKSIVKRRKNKIYVILKSKPYPEYEYVYEYRIVLKKYKFSTDSTLFFEYNYKKEFGFYAVKFSDIKFIGIQTPGTIAARITFGVIWLGIPPAFWYGIYRLFTPIYRKMDLEHEWQIVVENGSKKPKG